MRIQRRMIGGGVVGVARGWRIVALLAALVVATGACARAPRVSEGERGASPRRGPGEVFDVTRLYRDAGLLAASAPVPFVGLTAFLGAGSPDSTLLLLTLSMPSQGLVFVREGDQHRAAYEVRGELKRGDSVVARVDSRQVVRVGSFKETQRSDESVVFQHFVPVPPGTYTLALALRDEVSDRVSGQEIPLTVPRFEAGRLGSMVPVFGAAARAKLDTQPQLIASPRSTAVFGRDSVYPVYLEAYGSGDSVPVELVARNEKGVELWRDSVALPRRGTLFGQTLRVPVSRLGIGAATLVARRLDTRDSTRAPVFVSFGENLVVGSFDEMLRYLRYFAQPAKLQPLREATPETRGDAWARFLEETDPVASTPEHEGLRDYFGRLERANERFRDEGMPGWLTDRGMVFITLGEPDQVIEHGDAVMGRRPRAQVWEYREYRTQLVFIDQSGFNRWKLTPGSEAEFNALARRLQTR